MTIKELATCNMPFKVMVITPFIKNGKQRKILVENNGHLAITYGTPREIWKLSLGKIQEGMVRKNLKTPSGFKKIVIWN